MEDEKKCPWQSISKEYSDYITTPDSGKPVKVTAITFGECCKTSCPFYSTDGACTRAGGNVWQSKS